MLESGKPAGSTMQDVLVVEDDELMRTLVCEWLTQAGYRVRESIDGEAAIAALRQEPAALVITDMHMPRRDGVQLLTWLRGSVSGTPVIAMSGHFGSGRCYTAQGALALGASHVLPKPFTREELLGAVRALIGIPDAA
jgi:two-component system, chemotaxis family, chemotaxis protein CheY